MNSISKENCETRKTSLPVTNLKTKSIKASRQNKHITPFCDKPDENINVTYKFELVLQNADTIKLLGNSVNLHVFNNEKNKFCY